MSNRSISLTDPLYDYLLEVSLREPPVLRALREETMRLTQRSPEAHRRNLPKRSPQA